MEISSKLRVAEEKLKKLVEEANACTEQMYFFRDKKRELTAEILETRGAVATLKALEEEAKADAKAGK